MQMGALGQFRVITPESKTTKSIPNLITGRGASLTKEAGLSPFRPEAGGEPRVGMAGVGMPPFCASGLGGAY